MNDVLERDRDIAMVFQSYALYPHMTVAQNIAFSLKLARVPKQELKERVNNAARLLGLEALLDRRPKQLSGGQRQRVAMGRAIVRQPQAFLMDEPLSNLDAQLRVHMRGEIESLQKRLGVTTVYVTHDQVEAMTMGDRVAVLRDGVLQQVDTPSNVYDRPKNLFVGGFIGSPPMNLAEVTIERADGGLAVPLGETKVPLSPARSRGLEEWIDRKVIVGVRPEDLHGPRSDGTGNRAVTLLRQGRPGRGARRSPARLLRRRCAAAAERGPRRRPRRAHRGRDASRPLRHRVLRDVRAAERRRHRRPGLGERRRRPPALLRSRDGRRARRLTSLRAFWAPGRVNLIGEFTDLRGGLVLPAALELGIRIDCAAAERTRLTSDDFAGASDDAPWGRYVSAVEAELADLGRPPVGIEGTVHATVPIGAGLSSSAALEVAVATALCAVADFALGPLELAQAAQRAEHRAVGVPSGIMDQARLRPRPGRPRAAPRHRLARVRARAAAARACDRRHRLRRAAGARRLGLLRPPSRARRGPCRARPSRDDGE